MAWSVAYGSPPESDLIDEILLAAGKALYLANSFEAKCSFVLRAFNFSDVVREDPVITLEQVAALVPGDKMLGKTLQDLFARHDTGWRQEQIALLIKAREARNYVAHEAAGAIGELYHHNVQHMLDALRLLHAKVIDLAKGDNVVSAWAYYMEELTSEPLPSISVDYLDRIESWVFGHVPREWLDPNWKPDHQPPMTIRASLSYEPWYSRPCGCLNDTDDF